MANKTENRYVNVYIQTGKAQEVYDQLIAKQKKLTDEIAQNPKNVDKLRQELAKLAEPIDRAAKKLSGELTPGLRDTQAAVNNLGNRLKHLSEEDADFSKVVAQYHQGNKELEEQRVKAGLLQRTMKSFWAEAKTVAVGVLLGNTLQTVFQTILGFITGIFTGSAKISRELTGIAKTTNLSLDDVKKVNAELKKIDTETSQSELRGLAKEAGKLGHESVEDVIRFVKEADQINVALGEDLGQDAIISIGKLSKIFKVSMLEIGSAINEIGARSEASEKFAVDFLNMVSGVGPALKLSAGDLLGYGAALEIGGQQAEKSGTAINNFLIDFVRDADKFGAAAGFAKGELRDLINTKGTNEAFLQFLTRLKEANPEADKFLEKMQEIGVDGSRGANALLVLANNIQGVRDQQTIANDAIKEGTSLTNEFNKVNSDGQAELNKFKKNFASLFTSSSFQEAAQAVIRILNGFINLLKLSVNFIKEHGGLIATLSIIYAAATIRIKNLSIATAAYSALQAIMNVVTRAGAAALVIYNIIMGKYITGLSAATKAQLIWRSVMSLGAGPLGILLVGVGALAIGIEKLFSGTKKLTAEQKLQAEVSKKAAEILGDQAANVERLAKSAGNENLQLDKRKEAINELIKINPAFADTLKINTQGHLEGANSIAVYIKALNLKAEAEAKSALLTDKIREKQTFLNEIRAKRPGLADASDKTIEIIIQKELSPNDEVAQNIALEKREFDKVANTRKLKALLTDIDVLNKAIERDANQAAASGKKTADDTIKPIGDTIESLKKQLEELNKEKDTTPAGKRHDQILKEIEETEKKIAKLEGKTSAAVKKAETEMEKLLKDLQKIKDELAISSLSGFDKEMLEVELKYAKLRERAGTNQKLLLVIQELYNTERLQLIKNFAAKEVDAWQKGQGDVMKKQDDAFKKNLENLKALGKRIEDDTIKNAERFGIDRLAKDELAVLKSHGKEKLDAELKLLKDQESQELSAKDLTENQKLLIEEKFRRKRKEAELHHWVQLVEDIAAVAQGLLDIGKMISDAQTERENKELEADERRNNKKKENFERRLKAGTISQLQYNRELDKLDREREQKEKALRHKQFEREKAISVIQATINTAVAVTKAYESAEPPLNFILAAITAAAGAIQIALISSKKEPSFGKGTGAFLYGPSHADRSGGMPVMNPYTGKVHAFLEGGEGVVNKNTMADRSRYNIEGTPSQIISWLNAKHRGVHWESGAKLVPAWKNIQPMPFNTPAIRQYYALGGVFGKKGSGSGNDNSAAVLNALIELMKIQHAGNEAMRQTINQLQGTIADMEGTLSDIQKKGIIAKMPLNHFEEQMKRVADIRNAATVTL